MQHFLYRLDTCVIDGDNYSTTGLIERLCTVAVTVGATDAELAEFYSLIDDCEAGDEDALNDATAYAPQELVSLIAACTERETFDRVTFEHNSDTNAYYFSLSDSEE